MNTSIPTETPQVEHEIDAMLVGIRELLNQIRRDREEGEKIMAEADALRESNARAAKKLDETIARWR